MVVKQLEVDLLPQLKNVDLIAKRRVLSRVIEGSWSALLKGRGMEFAGFRQYTYGDDASKIDWNATLRAKDVLVREFEEYKTVNVFFLLDVSDSMLFSSTEKLKCEYSAEVLFNLATAIVDGGDSVGYAIFTDHIVTKHLPGIGREVIHRLGQDLSDGRTYGGKSDFKQVMKLVNSFMHQKSLIILISDFVNMPKGWERYIKMLAIRYDLIGIMIRDSRDFLLPNKGLQFIVRDPNDPKNQTLIDLKQYADLYKKESEKEEKYIRGVFEKTRAGFLKINTSQEPFDTLTRYFQKRTRDVRR